MNRCLAALLFFLIFCRSASSSYDRSQLEDVPLNRLIQNLEGQISRINSEEPKYAWWRKPDLVHSLARLHAMAFAYKFSNLKAAAQKQNLQPVFTEYFNPPGDRLNDSPRHFPAEYPAAKTPEEDQEARKHLNRAIELYRQISTDPRTKVPATLGLGWCLDQAGRKEEAIEQFRQVLKYASRPQLGSENGGIFENIFLFLEEAYFYIASFSDGWTPADFSVSEKVGKIIEAEAAEYLIKDLDPSEGAEEIKRIKKQIFHLMKRHDRMGRAVTPIAIPLRADMQSSELVDRDAAVEFDLDGSRLPQKWSWITPKAAWLVYLPKNEPLSGLNLFGNVTFWSFWSNGYEALCSLDDDGNNWITGNELRNIALWRDANSNGKVDPGEIISLDDAGISGLYCNAEWNGTELWSRNGVRMSDGSFRPSFDLILKEKR